MKKLRKLNLSRETLHNLDSATLARVEGGGTAGTACTFGCTQGCTGAACPSGQTGSNNCTTNVT
jgi:natural product precursor